MIVQKVATAVTRKLTLIDCCSWILPPLEVSLLCESLAIIVELLIRHEWKSQLLPPEEVLRNLTEIVCLGYR